MASGIRFIREYVNCWVQIVKKNLILLEFHRLPEILEPYHYNTFYDKDDSKITNTRTRYAFSIQNNAYSFKINNVKSIIFHYLRSTQQITTTHYLVRTKNMLILSDSLSSLQALQNPLSENTLIYQIQIRSLENRRGYIEAMFFYDILHNRITDSGLINEITRE